MMWMLEGLLSIDLMIFEFYEKKLLKVLFFLRNWYFSTPKFYNSFFLLSFIGPSLWILIHTPLQW